MIGQLPVRSSVAAYLRQDKAPVRQPSARYAADTVQERPAPPYLLPLVTLAADEDARAAIALDVARDVARGADPTQDDVTAAGAAVDWLTKVEAGARYASSTQGLLETARVLDRVYGRDVAETKPAAFLSV